MTPSIASFYAPERRSLAFGAWGNYTIVPGRHIGMDQATNRRPLDVPALLAGRVVRVVNTYEIGTVVVLDVGQVYFSYCHLSKDNPPRVGDWIPQGARVGRLAAGPKTLPRDDVDFPGTLWGGIHLHLVIGLHPDSAYLKIAGHRTLDKFRDPADYVASVLASTAGGGSTPFDPKGEDDMTVTSLYTKFARTGGQPVKAREKVNLHINDDHHVAVVRGPAKHVTGNLVLVLSGGAPYASSIQVTPVVRTWEGGVLTGEISLRAREIIFTGGSTFGEVAVDCPLAANQRLSFVIGVSEHDFVVQEAVFRGVAIS